MVKMIAADYIAERLIRAGVRHVFGVGGANIEDMFAAVQRRRPQLRAVLTKHEHGAGTAAAAYARVGGALGVVMTTSGGGAMNLVHSIAEARALRLPVLAIVGEPPSDVQGIGAFQDTSGKSGAVDAARVFGAAATWCKRAASAAEIPALLEQALAQAAAGPGSAVLLIAKDRQRAELGTIEPRMPASIERRALDADALRAAAAWIAEAPCLIIAGDEVARSPAARRELEALAAALAAPVAVTPDARDAFDNRHPSFVGVAGAMGHASVKAALDRAQVCVLVGTRLPLLARMGLEPRLRELRMVSLGSELPFVSGGAAIHVDGELSETLESLRAAVPASQSRAHAPSELATVTRSEIETSFGSAAVLAAIDRALEPDDVVLVDAGNTGASAAHYLSAPARGQWLLAMGMAGMGYAFGAAIGAASASGRRAWVIAGDGAFYMHGLEIHTAIEHALPITYVLFNNRAHGMCLVRERLLLGENAGYNSFGRAHLGAGLGAMFPGLPVRDCTNLCELAQALATIARVPGPSVIAVELEQVEVPPFVQFQSIDPDAKHVSRGAEP